MISKGLLQRNGPKLEIKKSLPFFLLLLSFSMFDLLFFNKDFTYDVMKIYFLYIGHKKPWINIDSRII